MELFDVKFENLTDFIAELEKEIDIDCRFIESDYHRISRLESDIDDAKQRIKENNLLLLKLKEILKEEKNNG